MVGFKANPFPILNNAKILCLTSKWEGFGLVATEALVLGKPVVATPVGGLPSIVNSTCGLLCDELQEFVSEISKLLEEESYYNKKSFGAQIRINEICNLKSYMKNLIVFYK